MRSPLTARSSFTSTPHHKSTPEIIETLRGLLHHSATARERTLAEVINVLAKYLHAATIGKGPPVTADKDLPILLAVSVFLEEQGGLK
jgi:hypothetical protein